MILSVASHLRRYRRFGPSQPQFLKHYSLLLFQDDQELASLLKSCTCASQVSQIHGSMVKTGLDHVPFPLSKLLAASTLDIEYAVSIFNGFPNPNLFMFTTMLRGLSSSDDPSKALLLFNYVRTLGIVLDQFSFTATIIASARLLAVRFGQGMHGLSVKSGHGVFISVKNTLLQFYCVSEKTVNAHQLFEEFPGKVDLVSWNTLMGGYLHASQPAMVIALFSKMGESGFKFRITTLLLALSAFGKLQNHDGGGSLHGNCIKVGISSDRNVVTALIHMYARAGRPDLGHRLFYEVPNKDVVLWNCLIDGYAKTGLLEEALSLLQLMKEAQIKPNSATLAGLLSTCASSGALGVGQLISDYVDEEQLQVDEVLGTALLVMYSKCGFLEKAVTLFDKMVAKDVKSWTAMITAYGVHGQPEKALEVFSKMEEEGFIPNEATFLAVLNACSHGGLVKEAVACYESMTQKFSFLPKVEHYGCMIDLLGRAGLLDEAHRLIKTLPVQGDASAWRALLAACRVYGNIVLGKSVKRELLETYGEHPSDSLLLSSAHAIAGQLDDHLVMQERDGASFEVEYPFFGMKQETKSKEAGCSMIDIDGPVLEEGFFVEL